MDINQMRREAINYYNTSSRQVQSLVYQFFKSMDANGDGGVDFNEIHTFLQGKTFLTRFLNGDLYRQLDTDGNGTLDFHEFITLFYIIFMCFTCDVCRVPLRGQKHLTCVTCFTSAAHGGSSYDICGSCYARGFFRHSHGYLVDYYSMIMDESNRHGHGPHRHGWSPAYQQSGNAYQMTSRAQNSRRIFGQIHTALQAASAVSTIASFATGISCNIM